MSERRTRRRFLATAASAAAAPLLAGRAVATPAGPPAKARRLKLGLASYSVRKFTFEQALDMCRELDVRYVNFKDLHMPMTDSPEALAEKRRKVEAAGLTIM